MPTIAISAGCPSGVGLELLLPALARAALPPDIVFRFCGPSTLLQVGAARAQLPWTPAGSTHVTVGETRLEWDEDAALPPTLASTTLSAAALAKDCAPGQPTERALTIQRDSLVHAISCARAGEVDGIVTLPIRKMALDDVDGVAFPGHTELLSARLEDGEGPALMVFAGAPFLLGLATVHLPLHEVSAHITPEKIAHALGRLVAVTRRHTGQQRPKIVVLGHNPHAGEGGRLGREELDAIAPAIDAVAARETLEIVGPVPADGFFAHFRSQVPDAVLAMHHDQGLGPYKILSEGRGVNLTWGLSCPRTSPDHGTADGIAGSGTADPASLCAALQLCAQLVQPGGKRIAPR